MEDYLQLLTTDNSNSENSVQELSKIARGLKQMAKTLNVPVLTLCQQGATSGQTSHHDGSQRIRKRILIEMFIY